MMLEFLFTGLLLTSWVLIFLIFLKAIRGGIAGLDDFEMHYHSAQASRIPESEADGMESIAPF
jgi:hypothetical protein